MNYIKFQSQNNEYTIEFVKREKLFSWSTYAKYICNIIFKNSIGNEIVNIQCSEKEFLDAMQALNCFMMNIGGELSDTIHFESDLNSYFMYITSLDYDYLSKRENKNIYNISPSEDEDDKLQISIYEKSMNGNVLRIYLEMDYLYLEDFVYNMYRLLEDIPYLYDMSNSSLMEFMKEEY